MGCNHPPILNNLSWNDSNPEYGNWVELQANVTDPDGSITEAILEVNKGNSIVFSNNATKNNSIWRSQPIKVDEVNTWYNGSILEATDGSGETVIFGDNNTDDFYINNSRPKIESVNININESKALSDISVGISSRGELDIESYDGLTNVSNFTNTAIDGRFDFPIRTNISVADELGLRSYKYSIDLVKEDTGTEQDTTQSNNFSMQFLTRTYILTNKGSPVNYTLAFSVPDTEGDNNEWSGTLDEDSDTSHVAGKSGDWINESQSSFKVPNEIKLSEDYTGIRQLEIEENLGMNWSSIDTTGYLDTPTVCNQINQTSISISASVEENRTVGYRCDPGNVGTPNQKVENKTQYERIWYNTTLTVSSNLTENSSLVWPIDDSNLKYLTERDGGSLEAFVNGRTSNVSVTDGPEMTYVTVQDDFGNSSLHEGTHDAALTYTIGDDDSSSSSDGSTGGSFPGGSAEDDEENESVDYSIDFTAQDYYTVAPGRTSRIYFTAWNYEKEENTVRISAPDTAACSYFNVQSNFIGDEFSKSTSLNLPGTRQNLGGGGSDTVLMAKVQLPNRTELETKGLGDTFTCSFETGAGKGRAGPLNLTVKAADTTPRWVEGVRQLLPDLPSTSFVESREICLPNSDGETSRLEQVQEYNETGKCSGDLATVPLPTGEALLLILAGFVFVAGYTWYKN